MEITKQVQNILEDDFQEVLENRQYLENIPLKKVLEIANLFPAYMKAKEEDPSVDFENLFIDAQSIKSRFEKRTINFKLAKMDLLNEGKLSEEELSEAERDVLNLEDRGLDIAVSEEQRPEKIKEHILQTFSTNATLKADFLEDGSEVNLQDLEDQGIDPKIIYHLRKTALDQLIVSFNLPTPKYDELSKEYYFSKDHKNNQILNEEDQIQGKKVEILYFNAMRMDRIQFPRFAEIFIPEKGQGAKYLKNEHHEDVVVVPVVVGNKNLKVKVPLWHGQVSTILE